MLFDAAQQFQFTQYAGYKEDQIRMSWKFVVSRYKNTITLTHAIKHSNSKTSNSFQTNYFIFF